MKENKKVIFRRVRGKVVPIKIDPEKLALGTGGLAAGAVTSSVLGRYAGKLSKKASRERLKGFNMRRNVLRYRKPGMPGYADSMAESRAFKTKAKYMKGAGRKLFVTAGVLGIAGGSYGLKKIRESAKVKQNRFMDIGAATILGGAVAGAGFLLGRGKKYKFITKVRGGIRLGRRFRKTFGRELREAKKIL